MTTPGSILTQLVLYCCKCRGSDGGGWWEGEREDQRGKGRREGGCPGGTRGTKPPKKELSIYSRCHFSLPLPSLELSELLDSVMVPLCVHVEVLWSGLQLAFSTSTLVFSLFSLSPQPKHGLPCTQNVTQYHLLAGF